MSRRKLAFVVGNDDYENSRLTTCVNDANEMEACLTRLGFTTSCCTNVRRAVMLAAWDGFLRTIQPRDVVVVYFSGHGVERHGVNYLLPLDATSPVHDGLNFSTMLSELNKASHTINIIILDACRQNPTDPTWKYNLKGDHSKADGRGLAHAPSQFDVRCAEATAEFFIAFACEPGTVAMSGKNALLSPFTASLLQQLAHPHYNVQELFTRVRRDVLEKTLRRQRPSDYCTLESHFSFNGITCQPPHNARTPTSQTAGTGQPGIFVTRSPREPLLINDYFQHSANHQMPISIPIPDPVAAAAADRAKSPRGRGTSTTTPVAVPALSLRPPFLHHRADSAPPMCLSTPREPTSTSGAAQLPEFPPHSSLLHTPRHISSSVPSLPQPDLELGTPTAHSSRTPRSRPLFAQNQDGDPCRSTPLIRGLANADLLPRPTTPQTADAPALASSPLSGTPRRLAMAVLYPKASLPDPH
eukprot:gnl/Hemi2/28385_TR9384_c0_g1_i1.p1 gnl/Hemi2/28385_TR9384_c0_g1~~gnl/Hemi2/28385_TR9384_c0_g1_i1.p1  ORF type:complete len:471 (+),score=65.89 gnl/Hemi2/28385_TR9384_c0_g1_i1:96-1508(+)